MEKPEFIRHLAVICKKYGSTSPEFFEILKSCEGDADFDQDEVMERISDILTKNQTLREVFPDLKLESLQTEGLVLDPAGKSALAEILGEFGLTADELVYEHARTGLPTLNPLYIAALAEKAQFDGDTPELRVGGDLPEGAEPAVPVETTSISLVSLGAQLHTAREDVKRELQDLKEERRQNADDAIMRTLGATGDSSALVSNVQNSMTEMAKPLNVDGYSRGQMPLARRVKPMTGSQLLALTTDERKKLAWGAISTTQGRRSATPVMGSLLEKNLRNRDLDVTYVQGWSQKDSISEGRWTIKIQSSNINPDFDTVNIAVLSLLRQISKDIETESPLEVEVKPINLYSEREVGWRAQVVYRNPPKKLPSAEEGIQSRV